MPCNEVESEGPRPGLVATACNPRMAEDLEFKVGLGFILKLCLRQNKIRNANTKV